MRPDKYLQHIFSPLFHTARTKQIFHVNPTVLPVRTEAKESVIWVYDYNPDQLNEYQVKSVQECFSYMQNNNATWINIDGLRKTDIDAIAANFKIHPLLIEDIFSIGQRPKMDDIDGVLYCLLNMLYYNDKNFSVEQEQVSIILGQGFVITFQEDAHRDVFDGLREKLKIPTTQLRQRGADYLCYNLLDMVVDHYFLVMEKLSDRIETLEEEIIRNSNKRSISKINSLRKELIVLKRNVAPVRELVNGLIKSESPLIEDRNDKYFKDVYDHIIQANDVADNYRDMMNTLQDLYISNVNLKLNEVMKVIAIVTCLLAPATVIGGIFGMNFDVIPYAHQVWGFYATVGFMLVVPLIMLYIFKRRGWF